VKPVFRDPFEISEKFVEKFNSIVGHDVCKPKETNQMKDLAYKMFQKAKVIIKSHEQKYRNNILKI